MGSPELAQYADFYADMTRRFGLTDSLELWRDISERLHQLTPEPEGVTYREVRPTACRQNFGWQAAVKKLSHISKARDSSQTARSTSTRHFFSLT